jgi:prepilin-type N-terminal cleavage/methylation domain-containing protein
MEKKQAGFTLLELLVAIVVISIGVLGVAALIKESQITNRRVRDKDLVYETLNKRVEIIREIPFVDVLEGDTIFIVPELPGGRGLINVVNEDSPTNHLKKITVSIHWPRWGSNATQGETIVTYRTLAGLGIRSL